MPAGRQKMSKQASATTLTRVPQLKICSRQLPRITGMPEKFRMALALAVPSVIVASSASTNRRPGCSWERCARSSPRQPPMPGQVLVAGAAIPSWNRPPYARSRPLPRRSRRCWHEWRAIWTGAPCRVSFRSPPKPAGRAVRRARRHRAQPNSGVRHREPCSPRGHRVHCEPIVAQRSVRAHRRSSFAIAARRTRRVDIFRPRLTGGSRQTTHPACGGHVRREGGDMDITGHTCGRLTR